MKNVFMILIFALMVPIDPPNKNAASETKTAKEMNKYNNRFRYKLFAYLALFIGIVIVLVVKNT